MSQGKQTLFVDADDTLWANNIHFERAIDEIERANIAIHGYGALGFARSLRQCYEHLVRRDLHEEEIRTVMRFGERILEQEIDILDGVPETLTALSVRHDLVLYTKGHHEEQRMKIERSGLGHHFVHHEIVSEKHEAGYRDLVARLGADPGRTWMIGNSPKSDINPALATGLGAVFIPHDDTWHLEHSAVNQASDRLLVLENFRHLLRHF